MNITGWETVIATAIASFLSLAAVLVQRRFDKKKDAAAATKEEAGAADTITVAAERLVTRYEKQIEGLDNRIRALEENEKALVLRILSLETGVRVLTSQLAEAHITPEWAPTDS